MDIFIFEYLKKRYFFHMPPPFSGKITHLSHCRFFSQEKPFFCDCGLLYDLRSLYSPLQKIFYPNCVNERYMQLHQTRRKPKSDKKIVEKLEKAFATDLSDLKDIYDEMKENIITVFGNTFPDALKRLDDWLAEKFNSR